MSFKEIKELRQAGKLDEALQMANQALETVPDNIWNKRAAAWVYYEYLKKYAHPDTFELFKENLVKAKQLQLPEDDKMFFDACAWQIGSLVFKLQQNGAVDYGKLNELLDIIRDFHFTKPSDCYSFIYKAFHKGYQNWSSYLAFADWWNLEHFRLEDYLEEMFEGRKMMSIAEQAYIGYSKKLLEGTPLDSYGQKRLIDREKIQSFLPKLDILMEKYPNYQYLPYFKAKLLLALGDDENVLSAFLPFAKQRRNVFWVWELMAEIFQSNTDLQLACYCKALSLNTPEDFLVKLRQTFAKLMIEKGKYDEAKTEIQKVIDTRTKLNWNVPHQLVEWTKQQWYQNANAKKNNLDLYGRHLKQAEEILFKDIPEEFIVIEFVNENKNMLHFVKNKQKYGYFKRPAHLSKPQIGDILKVRFQGTPKNGFFKTITVYEANTNETCEAMKTFEGTLKVIPPHNFGFVDDVFLDSKTVENKGFEDGKIIKGQAILSFNKTKNEWGWKSIKVSTL
jgi:tetratricopeptide (TPR) repeat protein